MKKGGEEGLSADNSIWNGIEFPKNLFFGVVDESWKPVLIDFDDGTSGLIVEHKFPKLFELDETDPLKWYPWVQGIQIVLLTGMMGYFTSDVIQKSLVTNPKKSRYGFKIILEFPDSKFQAVFCIQQFTEEQYQKIDDDDSQSILCEIVLGKHKYPNGKGCKAFWGKWNNEYYPYMPIDESILNSNDFKERMKKVFSAVNPNSINDHKALTSI